MAGSHPSFDAAQFKAGIHLAMTMAEPSTSFEKVTFHFAKERTYPPGTRLDQEGQPLDPTVKPVTTEPTPVQVPCAVEFTDARPEEMPVGAIRPTKMTLTLLDEDYLKVANAVAVEADGDRYIISYERPPIGLFEVTIYQFVCFAVSET